MKSQRERLLSWLKQHRAITTKGAIEQLGIYRCSERVRELIDAGHQITRGRVIVRNRYGEACRVAMYRLLK